MPKSQRNYLLLIAPIAVVAVWLAYGSGVFTQAADEPAASGNSARGHLEQAAESIVAAAKENVSAADSDQEALKQVQLALEALRIIGALGDFSTDPQVDKLISGLHSSSRPALADSIIQMRLSNKLRQWANLSPDERAAALDRYVADVKQLGVTATQAKMLLQISNMLGDQGDGQLVAKTINALLPNARNSEDAQVKRIAVLLEGTVRRLELPGKQLEIEGTLLDGKPLDWESYRGKVVLVDFFASWCGPCREEVPNVLNYHRAYRDKGFEVIGVNLDTEKRLAEEYIAQTGFKFPTVFGDSEGASGWDLPVARRYGITAIPRVMLVDQKGNVVTTFARGEYLGQHLQKLLGPPATPIENTTGSTDKPQPVIQAGGSLTDEGGVEPASAVEEPGTSPAVPEPASAPEAAPEK